MNLDIPKVKPFPADSVQCNGCGGLGCSICNNNGWLTPSAHPAGRKCYNDSCGTPIPPDQTAVYCSSACAEADA